MVVEALPGRHQGRQRVKLFRNRAFAHRLLPTAEPAEQADGEQSVELRVVRVKLDGSQELPLTGCPVPVVVGFQSTQASVGFSQRVVEVERALDSRPKLGRGLALARKSEHRRPKIRPADSTVGGGVGCILFERFLEAFEGWPPTSAHAPSSRPTAPASTSLPLYLMTDPREITRSLGISAKLFMMPSAIPSLRSEERRVGKECRSRWS